MPSDRLIIGVCTASGATSVIVRNVGGGGALTTGDGILLMDAVNGGTTSPSAFGPTRAGGHIAVQLVLAHRCG